MSISFIEKSDPGRPKKRPKVALVLAGGAISGGAFKLGGLVALDRFLLNRSVADLDIYVGISAGAFIGAFLAGGITPEELLRGIDGTSDKIDQLKVYDFYWPAWKEYAKRLKMAVRDAMVFGPRTIMGLFKYLSSSREEVAKQLVEVIKNPSYSSAERLIGPMFEEIAQFARLPIVTQYLPAGIFDNERLGAYVKRNLEKNGIPDDFVKLYRQRGVALYITATNLNTARGAVFGHDADHTVSISEAVMASTAIPGFYTPAKIGGEEYLDGGVRKTANASLAYHKGADLIILYNPLRPFMNRSRYQLKPAVASLSDLGIGTILNQSVRTLLQTRLYLGLEKLRFDPAFTGDVIVIEPTETDAEFFLLNPLAFWNRAEAARRGYDSVRRGLEQNFAELQRILAKFGIECDISGIEEDFDTIRHRTKPEKKEEKVVKTAHLRLVK